MADEIRKPAPDEATVESPDHRWDLRAMTPQALAAVPAGRRGPKCPANQHSPGWYVGFACAHCGDVD